MPISNQEQGAIAKAVMPSGRQAATPAGRLDAPHAVSPPLCQKARG